MKKMRVLDLLAVVLLPILAAAVTIYFKTNTLTSVLLFFGLPSLYISFRNPRLIKKSFIFALVFSIPLSIFVDLLAVLDGSWVIYETVFPFKILGLATIEVYLYGLLWGFMSIIFYEYFSDKGVYSDPFSRNYKFLVAFFLFLITGVLTIFFVNSDWLHIPYFYLMVGLVFVIMPLILFLIQNPKFLKKFLFTTVYFFIFLFIYEIAALMAEQWYFPSENFVGAISVLGHSFPLEELFVWMIAATPSYLAYYELYADDTK